MSKPKAIQATIKFYDQEIFVELPLDYNVFINNIMTMLQIEKNQINKFKISYTNLLDNKNYLIEDYPSFADFLDNCSKNYAKVINIELASEENNINNNEDEDNKKNNVNNSDEIMNEIEISSKKINKENYISREINNNNNNDINNIKNYGNINNNKNDEDNEAFEFSCLSINENNNIIEENNINNNKIKEKKKNFNNLFGENKFINNKVNSESEKNDILGNKYGIAFNITCAFCKQKKKCDIFYYCKDCDLYFCTECEKNQGMNHKHCYFKIRNKEQYSEINELHSLGDKLENINNNLNASIINNGYVVQESVKEIISEGSKFFGNLGTSIKNFFKGNENDNQNNKNNININNQINNDINLNDLNNPYAIDNKINLKNNINFQDENQLKELVKKAKMNFDLSPFSDIDIQKALIEHKGNIDKAASELITNFNM